MNHVKEIWQEVKLRDLMSMPDGWGVEEGREVYHKLLEKVEAYPEAAVFRISLAGVRRTDVSFPRESIVEMAYRYRSQKGFSVWDLSDENLAENWDAAATKRGQPLFVWNRKGYRLLGPGPSAGLRKILDLVMEQDNVTTSEVAKASRESVSNVSNKLRTLADGGYILRREQAAPTGGIEYVYKRIR